MSRTPLGEPPIFDYESSNVVRSSNNVKRSTLERTKSWWPAYEFDSQTVDIRTISLLEGSDFSLPRIERLPFQIRAVRTKEQLHHVVSLRKAAYLNQTSNLMNLVSDREDADYSENTVILIAIDKATSEALGTVRIQGSHDGSLKIADEFRLPSYLDGNSLAHVSRFAIARGSSGIAVRSALAKATVQVCNAFQWRWVVASAIPPLDRLYLKFGYELLLDGQLVYPSWAGGTASKLLAYPVFAGERINSAKDKAIQRYLYSDVHPDIRPFDSLSGMWISPRRSNHGVGDFAIPVV